MSEKTPDNHIIYPLVPLRDIVVFPHMVVPLFVGRDKSVKALEVIVNQNRKFFLVTQKEANVDNPSISDLYQVGTIASVVQVLKLPDDTVKVLVEGEKRGTITQYQDNPLYYEAYIQELEDTGINDGPELQALIRTVVSHFEQYVKLNRRIPTDILNVLSQISDPSRIADTIITHLFLKVEDKQKALEILNVSERLHYVYKIMESEIGIMSMEQEIRKKVKHRMEKLQRDCYLNEQLRVIKEELGEDTHDEVTLLEEKIKATKFSKEAKEKALAELKKLKSMSPMSSESTVVRNYLEWLISIPWQRPSKEKKDLKYAEKILDSEHYGLNRVKERIVEHLAVNINVGELRGPILCLIGPPGVGKTSLIKSIAQATGRQFVKIALGGVRDEAEVRGHRRTYIGALPGRIIQGMKKAKYSNPVFLLDEIDKLGNDWRGDPASALLEVLDPEQNNAFNDHYLEVDYNLSNVMFIATANSSNMPQPLLDRMEIIRIPGYTEDEKVEISKKHLIPKLLKQHGIKKDQLVLSDLVIRDIIRMYTRESGVRSLERELSRLMRKVVVDIVKNKTKKFNIVRKKINSYLGVERYHHSAMQQQDTVGVTTGLAWTEVGGELLMVEIITSQGKGKLTITGKLGDVMRESVQAACSYVKSKAQLFDINPELFEKTDIHVHVPEGAIPKDGPSAGVAMCTSLVSVLTNIPVKREVAMTGEITLHGKVLAIGGLKEKLIAAHREGLKTVIIPHENEKDLAEIPDKIKESLKFFTVKDVKEVLDIALTRSPYVLLPTASEETSSENEYKDREPKKKKPVATKKKKSKRNTS